VPCALEIHPRDDSKEGTSAVGGAIKRPRFRIAAMLAPDAARQLDNPVWPCLTTRHAHRALGQNRTRRYPAVISPIAGLPVVGPESVGTLEALDEVREITAEWLGRYNEIRADDVLESLPPARYRVHLLVGLIEGSRELQRG